MNLNFIMKKRQQQLKIHFLYNKNRKTRIANTFQHKRGLEYIKDCSGSRGWVGWGVAGGLVLEHVLHRGRHHGRVDERQVGSDPEWWVVLKALQFSQFSPGEHCRVRTLTCGHTKAGCTNQDMPDKEMVLKSVKKKVDLPVFCRIDDKRAPAIPLACWLNSKRTLEQKVF